jgi:putative membrane protein
MHVPARDRFPLACLVGLVLWWALLAVRPYSRTSWLHENLLVLAAVPLIVRLHFRLRFSHLSCLLLAVFFGLHLVGAHYTYSDVPLFESGAGGRNHYDRLVHFAFGLLLAQPLRELFRRAAQVRGFWAYFFPLTLVMALSMVYELVEWVFVLIVDPAAGTAFLGAQGDPWDAQKDMALASLGALITLGTAVAVDAWTHPGFLAEFRASLGRQKSSAQRP